MEFESYQRFEEWLGKQPQEICVAVAARTALRVWPIIVGRRFWNDNASALREFKVQSLLTAKVLLTTSSHPAAVPARADESRPELGPLGRYDPEAFRDEVLEPSIAAVYNTAYSYVGKSEMHARAAIGSAQKAAGGAALAVLAALDADAEFSSSAMFGQPLWHGTGPPEGLRPEDIGETLLEDDPNFAFFKRWYDGMVAGRALPTDLLTRIVTEIPRETWESGAEAVAAEIARIEAKFNVLRAARELLKDRAMAQVDSRLGIGGNSPPEPVDVTAEVLASPTIIWACIEEIAEQAEAERPDKIRITRALSALKEALLVCITWAGSKANLAVDTTIKWGIPTYLVANPDKVQALASAVERWLRYLP